MNKDVLSFKKIKINNDLLDEVWSFDASKLEHVDGSKLGSFAVVLAQYLIYFTYQRNLAKAEKYKITKYVDRTVSLTMAANSKEYIKRYKTKASATDVIIANSAELMRKQDELENIHRELIQIEGMDKVVSELIATIKREMTRRENELYQVRAERRN